MLSALASWFKSIFEQLATWLIDVVFMVFGWLWDALVLLLDSLGLADQIRTSATAFDSIPDSVWYFMNFFQIQFGLGIVIVSYLIRFMIRRIPVIG